MSRFGWDTSESRLAIMGVLVVVMLFFGTVEVFAAADFLGKWGSEGAGTGQFDLPHGVAVASNGDVYVADSENHRIQYFGPDGTYKGQWGESGSGDGQFQYPYGIAIAPGGDLYVADYLNNRIQYFSPTGAYKGQWGSMGSGNGQFLYPYDIAVAPGGDVYVADWGNHRIQYFSPTGGYKEQWGAEGTGDSEFKNPYGIDIAPNGDVYVTDNSNNRIQYFGATGGFKGKWGSFGTGDGQFNVPCGIAVAPNGDVYVTEYANNRIQYFTSTGGFKGKWGSFGTGDGQFNGPVGIAIAPNGDSYVAEFSGHRIQYFRRVTAIQHDAAGVTFDRFVTGHNSAYSGGGYVYGRWTGTKLQARFTGSKVRWIGPKQPSYGKADVYVDGVKRATVDCYASAAEKTTSAVLWESATLTDAAHTLEIRLVGQKNAASTGYVVVLDRFEVQGAAPKGGGTRHDEKSGTLSGPWIYGANAAYIAKGYNYSRYTNATFTKTFNGTRVAWIGPKTPGYGRAKVYIDGKLIGTVSQYGPTGWRYKVWESASLPYGNHTLRIVPTGTKDAASKGTIIVIDAIDVRP